MFFFKKTSRLLRKKEFDHVFKHAQHRVVTSLFVFLMTPNTYEYPRLGLVIPKKVQAKAHDRNNIKRLIRQTFRLKKELPSFDIVVLLRKRKEQKKNKDIIFELDKAWEKIVKEIRH